VFVRRASRDDLTAVQTLLAASYEDLSDRPSTAYLRGALGLPDTEPGAVAALFEEEHTTVLLGAFSGAWCALAIARSTAQPGGGVVVTIPWLYVEAGFRRCGVAEAVLAYVRDDIVRSGGGVLDVLAAPGDRAAKSLCEATGMKARVIVMSQQISQHNDLDPTAGMNRR
jgi:hypothetical protein